MNGESTKQSPKQSRVLKWAFIIGIIIVLNLLFNVGVGLFYERPDWEDFCGQHDQVVQAIETEEACIAIGGQWIESGLVMVDSRPVPEKIDPAREGYCNEYFTCQQEFDDARDSYNQAVFIILVILGLAAIVAGLVVKRHGVVANGLSLGGVLSLIIASVRYWPSAPDTIRFLILVVALGVLIWFGVKKFKQ